jgi:myo-inositol-1(or 4)-monophosphatase
VLRVDRRGCLVEGPPVVLSANERIDRMFWTYGFRGRPARIAIEVIGDLVDASSVGGGTFELGSAAFDMTRLLTGQCDAYVEPGPRIIADVPATRAEFERVGGGSILNNSPYDLAAAALLLEEAGAIVTDAYGNSLADRELLGSGSDFQMSIVCSSNDTLHGRILEQIDRGMERLRVGFRPEVRETE